MKRLLVWCLVILMGAHLINSLPTDSIETAHAVTDDELQEKKDKVAELQEKLEEVQNEKQSLSQTISYLETRVQLTQSQIAETEAEIQILEEQIGDLSGKIDVLDTSLSKLSEVLVNRVSESYKQTAAKPVYLLATQEQFSNFLLGYKYLKVSQQHDREVMFSLEKARTDFDKQKTLKEVKQQEIEALKSRLTSQQDALAQQEQEKRVALELTKNNERNYQSQLQRALSELEAIQSIIAGKGNETEAGEVEEGEVIASIIPGASACSNGAHLHFEVAKNGVHHNPAAYLSSKSVNFDNGPDGAFGFSGSWRWPLSDPVRITQGYGMTFYAATLRYYGGAPHTGIDMVNGDYKVKAVDDGTLYRGAIACGGGSLRYVRVAHDNDVDSFYLHVNY